MFVGISGSGRIKCRVIACVLSLLLLSTAPVQAQSFEPFVVRDIRVEGLQRISEGTVFNYLPINIGDTLDERKIQEGMRAIFSTRFFADVQFRRDGDTLVISVLERPTIADFTIEGNKDIKTEDLMESLGGVGLKRGRILNQSVLDDVERSLTDEYFAQGKYSATVKAEVKDLSDNQVEVAINIKEGDRARIRQINIVGNTIYSDEDLLDIFQLRTPHWLSWIKQDDRYSREALQGDLETLRSYYMDRGYADFGIDSTQVAISPDKKDIFITINIVEGELYKVSDVKLAGELILPESSLAPFVRVQPGQVFSQRLLTRTEELIQLRLGEEGYAFTDVEPITELDKESREVKVTFYVDPKNRVYVRRVNFNGADAVNDEVFRREMRQFEGGYLSKSRVDRSRIRLQRLPYIEKVEVKNNPVPGTPDLVDVDFDITEGLPGQFGGGIGYSDSQGLLFNANIVHTNFLGTGNRIQSDLNIGDYTKVIGASYTDPYITLNEVSRTLSASYRETTQFTSDASDFDNETLTLGINWGYPLTEYQRVSMGFSYQKQSLTASRGSAVQALTWVLQNGDSTVLCPADCRNPGSFEVAKTQFDSVELNAGWSFDTRNRALFADRGFRHNFGVSATVPGSDVEFYYMNYRYVQYVPLSRYFTLSLNADLGYGEAFGDTTSLPPYKNFFAGGPNTVRGYKENSLGPQDTNGNPYGGNMLVAGQAELILPIPDSWRSRSRFVLFYDVGNVFSTEDIRWTEDPGQLGPNEPIGFLPDDYYDFDANELRTSYGIAAEWLAPLGLFRFSYGIPINPDDGGNGVPSDDTENFQFSIGGAF